MDKSVDTPADALAGIEDGATVMLSGFQRSGVATALITALIDTGVRGLTMIANGAGHHGSAQAALVEAGRVDKVVCSSARGRGADSIPFEILWEAGKIALELVPQGIFAERIRAGGAGVPAFFTPVAADTDLAKGKERRHIDGRDCVLETALKADFTLLRAERADRYGNLTYRGTQANFGPVMAAAAATTAVEVDEIVDPGALNPIAIRTPGIFVDRIIALPDPR